MTKRLTILIATLALTTLGGASAWACSKSACSSKGEKVAAAQPAAVETLDHNTRPKGGAAEEVSAKDVSASGCSASKAGCGALTAAADKTADQGDKTAFAHAALTRSEGKAGCGADTAAGSTKLTASGEKAVDCPITADCPKEACEKRIAGECPYQKTAGVTAQAGESTPESVPGGGEQTDKAKSAEKQAQPTDETEKDEYAAMAGKSRAYTVGDKVEEFVITNVKTDTPAKLADVKGEKATVLVFWNQECPYVVEVQDRVAEFTKAHKDNGVSVVAIDAGVNNEVDAIKKHAEEKPFHFLVNRDTQLASKFGATRTPEVFILDKDGTIRYHGAFDSGRVKSEGETRKTYAADAVAAVLKGEKPAVVETRAFGCSLKYAEGVKALK